MARPLRPASVSLSRYVDSVAPRVFCRRAVKYLCEKSRSPFLWRRPTPPPSSGGHVHMTSAKFSRIWTPSPPLSVPNPCNFPSFGQKLANPLPPQCRCHMCMPLPAYFAGRPADNLQNVSPPSVILVRQAILLLLLLHHDSDRKKARSSKLCW